MKLEDILKKCSTPTSVTMAPIKVVKVDEDKQIITGEVYAPNVIDSHGDMMVAADVEELAYRFLAKGLNTKIDIMHNNKPAEAVVIESFVAKGNPDFNEGAWVVSTKIFNEDLWADIKVGKYNGYSMEIRTFKVPATVEIEMSEHNFGITEKNSGHDHAFFVRMNEEGKVVGGYTSKNEGHSHTINYGTATSASKNNSGVSHKHRYFLDD